MFLLDAGRSLMRTRSISRTAQLQLYGFAIFLVSFSAVFLPLGVYYWSHAHQFAARYDKVGFTVAASPMQALLRSAIRTLQAPFLFGAGNWVHAISYAPLLHPFVGLACFIGFLLAVCSIAHRIRLLSCGAAARIIQPYGATVLLVFTFVMAVPGIITTEGIPHSLRLAGILPPLIIFAALAAELGISALTRLASDRSGRLMLNASIGIAAIMLTQSAYYEYFWLWAFHPSSRHAFYPEITTVALEIEQLPLDIPKYVVVPSDNDDAGDLQWFAQPIVFVTSTVHRLKDESNKTLFTSLALSSRRNRC